MYWPNDPYTGAALCSLAIGERGNAVTVGATKSEVAKALDAIGDDGANALLCKGDNRASEVLTNLMAAAPIIAGLPDTHPQLLAEQVRICFSFWQPLR